MNFKDRNGRLMLASLTVAIVVGAIAVVSFRGGWPFLSPAGVSPPPAPTAATSIATNQSEATHPRAAVDVDPNKLREIGVLIETARQEAFSQTIRVVATVVPDESRLAHVHTRVAGWVEQLHIGTTGEIVRRGQPLAAVFSQELLSSQAEYLAARRAEASGPRSVVADSGRARLLVLGMTEAEIREAEKAGAPRRQVTINAPVDGIVFNRGVSVGTAVDPSTEIMTIADLSRVWVMAEVPEADAAAVHVGMSARLEFIAAGVWEGAAVSLVYPTLSERSRTLRARFELDNRDGTLRPGMFGTATFETASRVALTVPRDAIVDTGDMQHVFVVESEGQFVPRPVKLGARLERRVEILEGLREGERIVASGVFLIDSESRLRASGGGTGHAHGAGNADGARPPTAPAPSGDHSAHGAGPR